MVFASRILNWYSAKEKLEIVNFRGFAIHFARPSIPSPFDEIQDEERILFRAIFKIYRQLLGNVFVGIALYEGLPADFKRKIEFFAFVPRSGTPEASFFIFMLPK